MSFEDFAYKWLESVKDNIAYGTYAGYKQVLESRIIPYFKGDKIAHIKTPHILSLIHILKIPAERIRKYFPKDYTTTQMEETIVKLCEAYHRKRMRDRDSR